MSISSYKLEEGLFEIFTDDDHIFFEIDTENWCCEHPGIRVCVTDKSKNTSKLENIISDTVLSIDRFDNDNESQGTNDEHNDEYYEYTVLITCKKHLIKVTLYNYHNGYYPHWYKISSNKFKEHGQL